MKPLYIILSFNGEISGTPEKIHLFLKLNQFGVNYLIESSGVLSGMNNNRENLQKKLSVFQSLAPVKYMSMSTVNTDIVKTVFNDYKRRLLVFCLKVPLDF